ncbi:hypothetical protein [Brumimicrobium oceani]|uniref:Uncharacterized protein n=1 Tax=Brumimicrobium oceani TaxID=2100725 RepID=A0A2U2XAG3_9FLAO|nr:hypothetical protein [Brumimicrobium oceani]PWH84711.1 hypothetical protein DIT68_13390 [Brumimicrobium oceani]
MIKEYELLTAAYDGASIEHQEYKAKLLGTGVSVTMSRLMVSIPYNNHKITLINEYGASNTGTVEMEVLNGMLPDFEISSRNHLRNLFCMRKRYFSVKSKTVQNKLFLDEALGFSGMKDIAKENLFEPTIKTEIIDNSLFIKTEYHLHLKDKIGAAKALIDFYKSIIDRL